MAFSLDMLIINKINTFKKITELNLQFVTLLKRISFHYRFSMFKNFSKTFKTILQYQLLYRTKLTNKQTNTNIQ